MQSNSVSMTILHSLLHLFGPQATQPQLFLTPFAATFTVGCGPLGSDPHGGVSVLLLNPLPHTAYSQTWGEINRSQGDN